MKLTIKKPEIIENKLISKIKYNNIEYDMYFEVDKKYKKYLCIENSDAFLVALIPFIIKHEFDVEVEGSISSKLYYQITTYLIPMLCKKFKKRTINIKATLTNYNFNSKAVGASISCGVDSFYTLLKNENHTDTSYNITHLTFFNAGSHGDYGGAEARELYKKRLTNIKKFCETENYNLVTVDSNMNELIMMNHEKTHSFRTLSCVLALQKLFGKYYFASGFEFDGSHIDEGDTSLYDILNIHCLSNENITFYCSGLEASRMEKIKFISQFPITYKWLNVCTSKEGNNCSKCEKCIRTMTALDSIGKLENYKHVFDFIEFKKNKNYYYTRVLQERKDKIRKGIYEDIYKEYQKNNIKIPLICKILALKPTRSGIKSRIPKKLLDKYYKIKKNHINDGWLD